MQSDGNGLGSFGIDLQAENSNMKPNTLTPELLHHMDAYWRAANYLSVGQIYLYDNPLLKRPLTRQTVIDALAEPQS